MKPQQLVAAINELDTTALPNVHRLDDERLQVFWVMKAAMLHGVLETLTASQISEVLRDCCGIAVPRQRVTAILLGENGAVAKKKINGRLQFKLMKAGENELVASSSEPLFIDPSMALSKIRKVEEILGSLKGDLLVCDPYVDNRTLDFLAECRLAKSISLLTGEIHRADRFKRDLKAFRREHNIEVAVRRTASGQIHDRYIIHEEGMLLLGASLNGLGTKQSFIVALGEDIRRHVEVAFKKIWVKAQGYP